jgi:pyrroloquinoline quinone biosynthesis protein B
VHVEILGSAAGGGFPQWNCNCPNCRSLRDGVLAGQPRLQTQVAVSQTANSWFLLNASPDLRVQIERTAVLHPRGNGRSSPIDGVLLTGADVDQIAGLLSLREWHRFCLYCAPSIRRILEEDNSVFHMLERRPNQLSWHEMTLEKSFPLLDSAGTNSGIGCTVFSLGGRYPAYVVPRRSFDLTPDEAQLGVILESPSGGRLAYLPAVGDISPSLLERLALVDLMLFDGTFWSDNELIEHESSGSRAREMGHTPVSGANGSLEKLAALGRPRKVFIHLNNTNPMLDESSTPYREVREAGWEVAQDGDQFEL